MTQAQSGEEFHARECALRNVQGALIFVAFCALESFIVWREVDRAVRGNTLIDVLRDVAVITVCAKLLLMYKCFRERFVVAIVILRYAIGLISDFMPALFNRAAGLVWAGYLALWFLALLVSVSMLFSAARKSNPA